MRFRPWSGQAGWRLCLPAVVGLVLAGALGMATAADDKGKSGDGEAPGREVFEPGKVWRVYVMLSAKEYEAMQPRSGRGVPWFGGPAKPRPAEKPEEPV